MPTHDSDLLVEAGTALGKIVEQTPMAPEWEDINAGQAFVAGAEPRRHWNGPLVAVASAAAVFVVAGSVTLFGIGGESSDSGMPAVVVPATTTEEPPSTVADVPGEPRTWSNLSVEVTGVFASSHVPGLSVVNLIDGSLETVWSDGGETVWSDSDRLSDGAELDFEFAEPVFIESIVIHSYRDEADLRFSYRVRDFEVEYQTLEGPVVVAGTAPDSPDPLIIQTMGDHQGLLAIRVLSVWPVEFADGPPARVGLVVAEVEFFGEARATGESDAAAEAARQLALELEIVIAEHQALAARLDAEIANLESALATAEADAEKELLDRIAAAEGISDRMMRTLTELQQEHASLIDGTD